MARRGPVQPALFDQARPVSRMRRSVDAQLSAQRALGGLEPIDAGLVGAARTLADLIDAEVADPAGSRYSAGMLVGRLVPVMLELRGVLRDARSYDGIDDELVAIIGALRDATRPDPTVAG